MSMIMIKIGNQKLGKKVIAIGITMKDAKRHGLIPNTEVVLYIWGPLGSHGMAIAHHPSLHHVPLYGIATKTNDGWVSEKNSIGYMGTVKSRFENIIGRRV
jgi:GTP-dependent phosphoenolpyruvate carboxykinase